MVPENYYNAGAAAETEEDRLLYITRILNEPSLTWATRRAILRLKYDFDDVRLEELLPRPANGEFHPSDY